MSLEDELFEVEKGFWGGGEDYFRHHVDHQCLIAFTEMTGVQPREGVAASARDPQRWRDLRIERRGFLQAADDVAFLSYQASATRASGEPYRALVSTGYVRRSDGWKMAFHGQTPLDAAQPS